ncbi:MAG TPA: MaoC/PaaZ C-terminal domain-containing protein [Gaiellaceae bacterium]
MSRALHFEDLEVGTETETDSRTVTEADVVAFAGLSGDYNPLHVDAEFARTTPFGERIAHGLLGLAIASGLVSRTGAIEGTTLAFLATEWRFTAPIKLGDTITVRSRVADKRESSKPDRGVVTFAVQVVNQRSEVVQEGTQTLLMKRRP